MTRRFHPTGSLRGLWGPFLGVFVALHWSAAVPRLAAGAPAEDEKPAAGKKPRLAPEYRSGAVPNERLQTEARFERLEEHFRREEWAAGIAVADEILAEVTSPRYRSQRQAEAARKRRRLEERERQRAAEEENAAALGAGNAAMPEETEDEDDELHPTVEVYSTDGVLYYPVVVAVRERLRSLPEEALGLYRRTYEAPARQALEAAKDVPFDRSLDALRRVNERYPLAPAAQEASEELALRLTDLGRFEEAASVLEEWVNWPDTRARRDFPRLLAQSAMLHFLGGRFVLGRRLLDGLKANHSEAAVPIRGEAVLAASVAEHDLFVKLEADARERLRPPSPWPTVLGSYHHGPPHLPTRDGEAPALGAEAEWLVPFHGPQLSASVKSRVRTYLGAYPVLQLARFGDTIYVRRQKDLLAIDRLSGKRLWEATPRRRETTQPDSTYANYFYNQPGSEDYFDLGTKSITVFQPSAGRPPLVLIVDDANPISVRARTRITYGANRVLAYDARSGKLVWRLAGALTDDEARVDDDRGMTFLAPPTPAGDRLVVPAARRNGFYLLGLSAAGEPQWVRRIYSFNPAFFRQRLPLLSQGSSLAVWQGTAFSAAGHGVVTAVETASGRTRWLSRYRSRLHDGYRQSARGRWHVTQPIVVDTAKRTLLLAAPGDSDFLTAFDPASGEIVWEKHLESGEHHVLGCDRSRLYFSSTTVVALSLKDGRRLWESEELGAPGGCGFVGQEGLYVPSFGGRLALLNPADGAVLARHRILDPRLPRDDPWNLFPADGRLLAVGSRGVFSVLPQDASWKFVDRSDPEEDLFQRARLLRSEGSHRAALDALYRLVERHPAGYLHDRVKDSLLETVAEAARASGDATFVRQLLEHEPPLVTGRKEILRWRLREADLLRATAPGKAFETYLDLLREDGRIATSPEGHAVDVAVYAADLLREMLAEAAGGDGDAQRDWRQLPTFVAAESRARQRLEAAGDRQSLLRLVLFHPYAEATTEAAALLTAHHVGENDLASAATFIELLQADHPRLRDVEELSGRLRRWRAAEARDATLVLETPHSAGAGGAARPWRPTSWHAMDQGVLAASGPGSSPLPAMFSLTGTSLRAHDPAGKLLLERELPGFPDVEDIKTHLQSHLEEPAVAHARDRRLVLFTAAGCYGFRWDAEEGDKGFAAKNFRLAWVHNYPHALDAMRGTQPQWGWSRLPINSGSNLFPELFLADDGDPCVLLPSGELRGLDFENGKLRWRYRDETQSVVGRPRVRGPWVEVLSTSPPGLQRYRIPQLNEGRSEREAQFYPGAKGARSAGLIEGLATISQGAQLELRSVGGGRLLWRGNMSGYCVRATASALWISENGKLTARSLRTGRVQKTIPLPAGTRVSGVFDDPRIDGAGLTLVLSEGSAAAVSSYYSRTHTGSGLSLLRLDGDNAELWRAEIAGGEVTYDNHRLVTADGRWVLAYNAEEEGSEKWYTRVVAIEPSTGALEHWLELEISGKGTGQPPRLSTVVGGLAVGNADGFGWFTNTAAEEPGEEGGTRR